VSIDRGSTYPQLMAKLLLDIPGLKGCDAACVRLKQFARGADCAHQVCAYNLFVMSIDTFS